MEAWNKLSKPPLTALKQIRGGRLKGMTDVNPMWRYRALTEVFGPCGVGWKFEIEKQWTEQAGNEVLVFSNILLYIKHDEKWSDPIPGNGGSKMVAQEKSGPHNSDECFKMSITDALSTAMKMIGVASEIYEGNFDGTKYKEPVIEMIDRLQKKAIVKKCKDAGMNDDGLKAFADIHKLSEKTKEEADEFLTGIHDKIVAFMEA